MLPELKMDWDLVSMIAAVVIFIGTLVGLALWLAAASCTSQANRMGVEHSWGPLQDCMIRTDDRWEPLDWQHSIRIKR